MDATIEPGPEAKRMTTMDDTRDVDASNRGRRLRIATPLSDSFAPAIEAAGHECVPLPDLPDFGFNRSIEQRIKDGPVVAAALRDRSADLLLDLETSALTFVPGGSSNSKGSDGSGGSGRPTVFAMAHQATGTPYVSHIIDPVTEMMQQVDWKIWWRLLEHEGWIKWVWRGAHAEELIRLGVTNVLPLTMGICDGDFPTEPVAESPKGAPVGFMGHPATSLFSKNVGLSTATLKPAMVAAAARSEMPDVSFCNVYFDLYRFDEPPNASEPDAVRAEKAARYFSSKLGYCLFLATQQRDRFVLFLKEQMPEHFELVGSLWGESYGLSATPEIRDRNAVMQKYRDTAINLNLLKGNNEHGLNVRHFEITAAGGFMLTYPSAELADHFEIGKECAVFENERDLLDKIRYYLAHPAERVAIAQAGQRRTLRDHRYSRRINQVLAAMSMTPKPVDSAGGVQGSPVRNEPAGMMG